MKDKKPIEPIVKSTQNTPDAVNVTPGPILQPDPTSGYQNVLNNLGSIQLYHIPTNETIVFKAFITNFSDNYTSNWNEEIVYGRMDPIPTFESTIRKIDLDFDVPAFGVEEAIANTDKIDRFIQRLYPVYKSMKIGKSKDATTTNILSTAPVWRIKFANLISKTNSGNDSAKKSGLVSYIQNFNFAPDFEQGVIMNGDQIYPKSFSVTLSLTILHEHLPGFTDSQKKFGSGKHLFPYGVGDKTKVTKNKKGVKQNDATPPPAAVPTPARKIKKNPANEILRPVYPHKGMGALPKVIA